MTDWKTLPTFYVRKQAREGNKEAQQEMYKRLVGKVLPAYKQAKRKPKVTIPNLVK